MSNSENNDTIDLRRFFRSVRAAKWIYLVSALFFIGLGVFYQFYKMPQYKTQAVMLIEDSSGSASGIGGAGSGMASMMKMFSMGGFASSSVDNEILILKSHSVLKATVQKLDLNVSYIEKDGISRKMLYDNSPVKLEIPAEFYDKQDSNISVKVKKSGNTIDVKVCSGFMALNTLEEINGASLPCELKTPFGEIYLLKTDEFSPESNFDIQIKVSTVQDMVTTLGKIINIDFCDKLADAISLEIKYPNKALNEAIINTLMAEYNDTRRSRRQSTSTDEASFLNERINELMPELKMVEADLENYKRENNLVDIGTEAEYLVKSSVANKQNIARTQFVKSYYEEVLNKLKDNSYELIPSVEGLGNPMIRSYNDAILQRNELAHAVKPGNVHMQRMDENIDVLRASLIKNVEAQLDTTMISLKAMTSLMNTANARLMQLPKHEREFVTRMRDTELKNALYMFLMQKRESALIQAASTDTLGFVIDSAYTATKPDITKGIVVFLVCLLLAIVLPTLFVIVRYIAKTGYVDEPMDMNFDNLESTTVKYDGSNAQIGRLRDYIAKNSDRKVVYVACLGSDEVVGKIKTAFGAISLSVASVDVCGDLGLPCDNDSLRGAAFDAACKSAAVAAQFVFVNIPQPQDLSLAEPVLAADNAQLLVVVPAPSKVTRKKLKSILASVSADTPVTVCIDAATV